MVFIFQKYGEKYLYHRIVYLIKEMQADKQNSKKEKDVLAGWINKQLNSKNKADKKEWKSQKRNLIPKPKKLTAKERGIVQWITRFESGYRGKRIDTRFFVLLLWKTCFKCPSREIHSPSGFATIFVYTWTVTFAAFRLQKKEKSSWQTL